MLRSTGKAMSQLLWTTQRHAATLTCAFAKVRVWAMTDQEALREARRRWGASGTVQSQEPTWITHWYRFAVGQRLGESFRTGDRVTRGKKRSRTPTVRFAMTRADGSIIKFKRWAGSA